MITHEIRERKGGGITHTPDENMVGSQISAVCAVSFELFFSATQELINFSLFNLPPPPTGAHSLVAVRLCHRIAYSLCAIYFFANNIHRREGAAGNKKRGATGRYR